MFLDKFLSAKAKYEIRSAFNTVVSAVIVELGVHVLSHQEFWDPTLITRGMIFALLLALVRAAWKAGLMFLFSILGLKVEAPVPVAVEEQELQR